MRDEPEIVLMRELFVNDQQNFEHLNKWTILIRKYDRTSDQAVIKKIINQPINYPVVETLSNEILGISDVFEKFGQSGMKYNSIKKQGQTKWLTIVLNEVVVGLIIVSQRSQETGSAQVSLFLEENIANRDLLAVNAIYILKTFGYKVFKFKQFIINTPMKYAKKFQWLTLLHSRVNLFSGAKIDNEPITLFQSVIDVIFDQQLANSIRENRE